MFGCTPRRAHARGREKGGFAWKLCGGVHTLGLGLPTCIRNACEQREGEGKSAGAGLGARCAAHRDAAPVLPRHPRRAQMRNEMPPTGYMNGASPLALAHRDAGEAARSGARGCSRLGSLRTICSYGTPETPRTRRRGSPGSPCTARRSIYNCHSAQADRLGGVIPNQGAEPRGTKVESGSCT
jgi:hypothetical protein